MYGKEEKNVIGTELEACMKESMKTNFSYAHLLSIVTYEIPT